MGAIAPPAFAKVFMQPVTVPAASPPISRQTAHAELIDKSATPAATAISNAEATALPDKAAAARINPLVINVIAITPDLPILKPYRLTQWSVQSPPKTAAAAPESRTTDASPLAALAEKPLASRR